MKRLLTGLLALCLLWGPPVSAASGDGLNLSCREQGSSVSLTLEGLDRQVYALQLKLTLEGEYPETRFDPISPDVYSPDCHVEAGGGETDVIIYLVAEEEPLTGRSLSLGTLTAGDGFRLPGQADLLLLDRSLNPIRDGSISLTRTSSGSGNSGDSDESDDDDSSSGTASPKQVRVAQAEHGTVTAQPARAREGETVTLNITPDAGYVLESITVRDSRGRAVPLTKNGANRCTFSMPALDVNISATFVPEKQMSFQDVKPGDWYYDAVRYVFEAGLMNGTSSTAFTPNSSTTRGQIVTILYRLEGSPAAGANQFSDVAPGAYYASAVSWAAANGITNGYNDGTFRPDTPITREQMAAFLFRYASYQGQDVSKRAELNAFTDAEQIAPYAVDSLRWAVSAGLINGVAADTLAPGGTTTRAQAAVILSRLAQRVH